MPEKLKKMRNNFIPDSYIQTGPDRFLEKACFSLINLNSHQTVNVQQGNRTFLFKYVSN